MVAVVDHPGSRTNGYGNNHVILLMSKDSKCIVEIVLFLNMHGIILKSLRTNKNYQMFKQHSEGRLMLLIH